MSVIAREKTSEKSYWGAGKSLHHCNSKSLLWRECISVISVRVSPGAGSCLQWQGVCNNEVIARLESIVD